MRKLVVIFLSVFLSAALFACGAETPVPSPTPRPELSPEQIISAEDAAAVAGYTLVQSGGVKTENNAKTVVFLSEPQGMKDAVKVTIRQAVNGETDEDIKQEFLHLYDMRPRAEPVSDMANTYIAYPYICFYENGYLVQITAGSGADDTQKAVLMSFAKKARENINKLSPSEAQGEDFLSAHQRPQLP